MPQRKHMHPDDVSALYAACKCTEQCAEGIPARECLYAPLSLPACWAKSITAMRKRFRGSPNRRIYFLQLAPSKACAQSRLATLGVTSRNQRYQRSPWWNDLWQTPSNHFVSLSSSAQSLPWAPSLLQHGGPQKPLSRVPCQFPGAGSAAKPAGLFAHQIRIFVDHIQRHHFRLERLALCGGPHLNGDHIRQLYLGRCLGGCMMR